MAERAAQIAGGVAAPLPATRPLLQRQCACGNHTITGGDCRECSEKKRLGQQAQIKIGAPEDTYEQEADRVADRVSATSMRSSVPTVPPPVQHLSVKPAVHMKAVPASVEQALGSPGRSLDPSLRQNMEQQFGYDFSHVRAHTGATAERSARDVNASAYTVGRDIVFGTGQFAPRTHEGRWLIAHELTHVVQQSSIGSPRIVTGRPSVPSVTANAKVASEAKDDQGATHVASGQFSGPIRMMGSPVLQAKPTPGPKKPSWELQVEAARTELARIEKLRAEGKEVEAPQEYAAQQQAVATAQKTLGRAGHAGGTEVGQIIESVQNDMTRIESARYRGYQDALSHLNLAQLDEKEQATNVKSFALSLAGNLIWALSGLIAITPVGLEATIAAGLLEKYGVELGEEWAAKVAPKLIELQTVRNAKLGTAVGVAGAMLAQFANGFPSGGSGGGNVSGPLIQLQQKLNETNTTLFNALKRDLYSTLLSLIELAPPNRNVNAQKYAGWLEAGIRHSLFSGYYENGGVTDNGVNPALIQTDARNQLLRRLVVTSGKISGEGIAATKLEERGVGKMVASAVSLLGGAKALQLGDYELVSEQLYRAARELELEGLPKVDTHQLRDDFANADTIVLSARVTDGGVGINNRARDLVLQNMAEFEPAGVGPSFAEVHSIEIRKKDLRSAKIRKDGALVYSAEEFRIRGRGYLGGQHMEDEYDQIRRGPVALSLIYKV